MKTMQSIFQAPRALALAFALSLGGCGTAIGGESNPVLIGSWPGFTRGSASAIVLCGNYAYVGKSPWEGDSLDILDLSQPLNPQRVGRCDITGFLPYDSSANVAVSGHFMYLASSYGLEVMDIADPGHPQLVGGYEDSYPDYLDCLAVSGNYAYLAGERYEGATIHFLRVFDVSNPANPQRMGSCPSRKAGNQLVVSGNYAYLAEIGGLEVIDISNPADPKPAGWYAAGGAGAGEVALSETFVFLAGSYGLQVIDVSNPASPRRVGQTDLNCGFGPLAMSGHCAYGVTIAWPSPPRLMVIDLFDHTHPQTVGTSDTLLGTEPLSIAVSGHHAYVGSLDSGLQVIDIANPASPQALGANETMGTTDDVALSGNYAYLAEGHAGLKVIDVSNAASPRKVSEYYTIASAEAVVVSDKYAYVNESDYIGDEWVYRLEVVDISNPAEPKHVCWYNSGTWIGKPAVSGNYAYLPEPGGLQVIDISNPAGPQRVGGYADARDLTGLAVAGDRAYVANGADGLLVLDVSNPTNVAKVGGCKIGTDAGTIAVSGHYACLAGTFDLHVIDISNPTNPLLVGRYELPEDGGWWIYTMAVVGNYVYLNLNMVGPGGGYRLEVIDISNPSHPERVGSGPYIADGVLGMEVSGNQIHLAGGTQGLLILELQPFIKSVANQGQDLKLSWEGFGLARLQRATRLTNPDWSDVPGSEATNSITLPIEGASAFFRLDKP
jgi:hypothetical protein